MAWTCSLNLNQQACRLERHEHRTHPNTLCSVGTDKHRYYTSSKPRAMVDDVRIMQLALSVCRRLTMCTTKTLQCDTPPNRSRGGRTSLPRGLEAMW